MSIIFQPKSTLAFIIAISLIAVFTGIIMQPVEPVVAQRLEATFRPLLGLGILFWLIFIVMAASRNVSRIFR